MASSKVGTDALQHIVNTTDRKMSAMLPDGSLVGLYPESRIGFRERTIYLEGKADFKVVKDETRPFIVYSGEIGTTVLGTSFTVTSFEQDNIIKVRLHEGKVLVRPVNKYLAPGDLLVYDKRNKTVRIFVPHSRRPSSGSGGNSVNLPEWYRFEGQPLTQCLTGEPHYGVEIDYLPSDTRNRYFTGRYDNMILKPHWPDIARRMA